MKAIRWISTNENVQWEEMDLAAVQTEAYGDTLEMTGTTDQVVDGFGGCFNELEWRALSHLPPTDRANLFEELFDPDKGCRFRICRLPVGANDYSLEWYSLDEHPDDYAMDHFTIDRDKNCLIPFIKEALAHQPDLKLFASPWSPPTWMKFPRAHNHGTMIWTKEIRDAYALYFLKFVQSYAEEGVRIDQIHVQNEPMSDQKFPSCVWTGEQFRVFIRDHMGPLFEANGIDTDIWLGTINGPEVDHRFLHTGYDQYSNLVLSDPAARKYIKGVGYQWCGKYAMQQTHMAWPEMKLMQTENECGDGSNSWAYAHYIFNLFRHYLVNGASAYVYWNMVLEPEGRSTWGWKQNAMVTVEPETGRMIFNPEFYVMKHFSHFIDAGAVRMEAKGHWAGNAVVFRNPDGNIVAVVGNGLDRARAFSFKAEGETVSLELPPMSWNTIVFE